MRIGLSLSGGGFRATFFHLGVIRFLQECGRLKDVTHICSVSGGSIVGAHLAQNWHRYTRNLSGFDEAADEIMRFGQLDLRGRVVRRWLLSYLIPPLRFLPAHWWERTALLQRFYDTHLYRKATLNALDALDGGTRPPELHLLATSLTTGNMCSFTKDGFWTDDETNIKFIRAGILRLSLAVAASSAFPPLFPPVRLTRHMLGASTSEMPYDPEYLADGGIYDNLGLHKFHRLNQQNPLNIDLLIVSDAGGEFDWETRKRFASIFSRSVRSADILMKRNAELQLGRVPLPVDIPASRIITCGIRAVVATRDYPAALNEDLQQKIKRIRTDLDRFSLLELSSLQSHGFGVARACLQAALTDSHNSQADMSYGGKSWTSGHLQKQEPIEQLAKVLELSRHRALGIWNLRDWATWVMLSLAALVTIMACISIILVARISSPAIAHSYYVTDRESGPGRVLDFRNRPGETLHFGDTTVGFPKGDSSFQPAVLRLRSMNEAEFYSNLAGTLATTEQGSVTLLLHGFSTTLQKEVEEDSVIAYDLRVRSTLIDFSWPSGNNDYRMAEANSEWSEGHLVAFLSRLVDQSGVRRIDVVAEDLGARIMVNALARIVSHDSDIHHRVNEMVLVNPDIDASAFASLESQIANTVGRVTIYRHSNSFELAPLARLIRIRELEILISIFFQGPPIPRSSTCWIPALQQSRSRC